MAGETQKSSGSIQPDLFNNNDISPDKVYMNGPAVMHCDGACSGNPGRSEIVVSFLLIPTLNA